MCNSAASLVLFELAGTPPGAAELQPSSQRVHDSSGRLTSSLMGRMFFVWFWDKHAFSRASCVHRARYSYPLTHCRRPTPDGPRLDGRSIQTRDSPPDRTRTRRTRTECTCMRRTHMQLTSHTQRTRSILPLPDARRARRLIQTHTVPIPHQAAHGRTAAHAARTRRAAHATHTTHTTHTTHARCARAQRTTHFVCTIRITRRLCALRFPHQAAHGRTAAHVARTRRTRC